MDSISITYALLDPLMAVARPVAAFFSAMVAGLSQNIFFPPGKDWVQESGGGKAGHCCSAPEGSAVPRKSLLARVRTGLGYATGDLWHDIAVWFLVGILLSGMITVLVPETLLTSYGRGLAAKLVMLVVGIPLYTCASASTPIAAALILKGVSPGAALVYLLVGPATSMASLTILPGLLGRKATLLYLVALAASALAGGILLDVVYDSFGISARAVAGQAAEIIPYPLQLAGAVVLLLLSVSPVSRAVRSLCAGRPRRAIPAPASCGCSGESGSDLLHGFRGS